MGFDRSFTDSEPRVTDTFDLGYPGYYFSGTYKNYIYLGHKMAPAHLLQVDLKSRDTIHYTLNIKTKLLNDINQERLKVVVTYPHVFLVDGSNGIILKANLHTRLLEDTKQVTWRFDNFTKLPNQSVAFRTYHVKKQQNMLVAIDDEGKKINEYLPEKQQDGIFDTDGQLYFNNQHLVYLFYYRNQFLVFNDQLSLKYRGKTIDTISKAQIKVTSNERVITMETPPLRVNKNIFLDYETVYIESMIKADNQSLKEFSKNVTIDRFQISNGSYAGSFYLPKYENKRAIHYTIVDSQLIALYDEKLLFIEGF